MLCTTADSSPAASDELRIVQRLEGQDVQGIKKGTSGAQALTVSFWVKSNVTGDYVFNAVDLDNTRLFSQEYTILASGVWEKKIISVPADSVGVLDNDNTTGLLVSFWLGAGTDRTSGSLQTTWGTSVNANLAPSQTNLAATTSNYWQITGVQLEVGSVATPFEFKTYGQELAECQRYYYKTVLGATNKRIGTGYAASTTLARIMTPLPVSMRTAPTALEQSGTASDYGLLYLATGATCSFVPLFLDATTEAAFSSFSVSSGLTAGNGLFGYLVTGTDSFLAWSAEL
jgi:hypothetical protein